MPKEFSCSSCELTISIGSYHSFDGVWITALYCQHCGAQYQLQKSTAEFFNFGGNTPSQDDVRSYILRGPSETQDIVVAEHSPIPELTCDMCMTKGPFGTTGPITDRPPAGLGDDYFSFDNTETKPVGKCPRCKNTTMELSEEWTT